MKKLISVILFVVIAASLVSCGSDAMTHAEYMAAEKDSEVVVDVYVQATQSWWENKITVYAADEDGAYFIYEMECSEEDSKKLTPGTKIQVSGVKTEWSGEVEIVDATFKFAGDETYVSEPVDLTSELGKDTLVNHQNELALFKGMTVKSVAYKGDGRGDDIYVTFTKGGVDYEFCVERYLTDPDSALYKAVEALKVGDIVDVEGFLYWYNGPNPHITEVNVVGNVSAKSEGVMTYAEYVAAALNSEVVVEAYVQATQSWWDNKITVYAADSEGAYFIYELECSEADAAKLTPGTKIKVTGVKIAWEGEVEISDATFEFAGDVTFTTVPRDLTVLLGTENLIKHQNELALFTEMTVKSVTYKGDARGDDIYLVVTKDGTDYNFCVERYLTDPDTELYKAVEALAVGDVIDIEAFLYWYGGPNPHIVGVSK